MIAFIPCILWVSLIAGLVLTVYFLSKATGEVEITLPSIIVKWGKK